MQDDAVRVFCRSIITYVVEEYPFGHEVLGVVRETRGFQQPRAARMVLPWGLQVDDGPNASCQKLFRQPVITHLQFPAKIMNSFEFRDP